jgi:hypothetical protein
MGCERSGGEVCAMVLGGYTPLTGGLAPRPLKGMVRERGKRGGEGTKGEGQEEGNWEWGGD